MTSRRMFLAGLASLPVGARLGAAVAAPIGSIRRLDPELDRIVAPSASVTVLARGYKWAEGPVWAPRDNCLLFNDPPSNILYRWRPKDGVRPFLSPSGLQGPVPPGIREPGLNGLAIDSSGALIAADSGTRAIVRIDLRTRARTILADRFQGKRFNSPNDLCVAPSGMIYFTDPPYGLTDGDRSALRELEHCGLYALGPDGALSLLDGSHRRPNGVAVSPDGRTLYLALSDEQRPEVLPIRSMNAAFRRVSACSTTCARNRRRACPACRTASRFHAMGMSSPQVRGASTYSPRTAGRWG